MESWERPTARLRLRRVTMDDLAAFVALESALRAREEPPRTPPATSPTSPDRGLRWRAAESVARARMLNLYYRVTPDRWGQGIATETAREAIATAATVHPAWPVLVETRPWNTPAIRVAERAGLTQQEPRPGDKYAVLLLEPTR